MQKETAIQEVKLTEDQKAFNVRDVDDVGYFCRDLSLLPIVRDGGPVILVWDKKEAKPKDGKPGRPYNLLTGATKKGQTVIGGEPAPRSDHGGPLPPPVPVSGPEHGMVVKLVGDLYIAGKIDDKHRWFLKMAQEIDRVLGTGK